MTHHTRTSIYPRPKGNPRALVIATLLLTFAGIFAGLWMMLP
jgi:hypothetical protein